MSSSNQLESINSPIDSSISSRPSNQLDPFPGGSPKGKRKDKYYSLSRIQSYKAIYNMIIGKRSNGKTFACLSMMIRNYVKNGKQSAYVRRFKEDFRGKRGEQLFASVVSSGLIGQLTNGEWTKVRYYSSKWYLSKFDDVLNRDVYDTNPFCFGFSLSEMEHDKSVSYPDITTVVFDEFMTRQYYLPDEFVVFCNVLSTIIRDRNDVTIYMLGNTVNKYCPYFKEMGLKHVVDMELGAIDIYRYGESKLSVAVERCDNPESTTKSNMYFTFDNPKLEMITGGAWEIDIYPHLPVKYVPRDVLLRYFIVFDGITLQCEIVLKEKMLFTYVHKKTTEIRDEVNDIVFSPTHSGYPNWARNILRPVYEVQNKIRNFITSEKVFYQDNEIGEVVRNYLMWCKKTDVGV